MLESSSIQLENVLGQISKNLALTFRFVNTLSLLEYVGARKILKSQASQSVDLELLTHASEEMRHARVLKQIATKMSEQESLGYSPSHLLCGKEAENYFQGLDRLICTEMNQDAYLNYLYTTLLVEERAMVLYPAMKTQFSNPDLQRAIHGILAEENHHLEDVERKLKSKDTQFIERSKHFRLCEEKGFQGWLKAVQATFSPLS